MVLIIDNYDSFVYNLYQYVGVINQDVRVVRNDEITIRGIKRLNPTHLILSPGPGRPEDAGICEEAILYFKDKMPVLGVCLGHQAICEAFGGVIIYSKTPMHGKKRKIHITSDNALFRGLPPVIEGARYHSLCVEKDSLPDTISIIAIDDQGEIMGVKHKEYDVFGVQFHPESVLTEYGGKIIENFLSIDYSHIHSNSIGILIECSRI